MEKKLDLSSRVPVRADVNQPIRKAAFCSPNRSFQVCDSCLMDTTDPLIIFNDSGICNYCSKFSEVAEKSRLGAPENNKKLTQMLSSLESERAKAGDVIIGVSGGVDSSYLLAKACEWGLRPIPVHVDAGWNSDEAVSNIHKLVNKLGLDLVTRVVHWPSVRELQGAFLKSGLANLDVPQDYLFVTSVLASAKELGVRTILSGTNFSTESVLPSEWGYDALDGRHIREVLGRFGSGYELAFPIESAFSLRARLTAGTYSVYAPLDFIPYDRNTATEFLAREFGWREYGHKHYESRWTRFFQSYVLPYRFGYDKRKAHLSSRIISGELTREEGAEALARPLYEELQLRDDEQYISSKLGMSVAEVREAIEMPLTHYSDFPNSERALQVANRLVSPLMAVARRMRF